MKISYSKDDLLKFEEGVATEFATGSIKSPVHLGGGNERSIDCHLQKDTARRLGVVRMAVALSLFAQGGAAGTATRSNQDWSFG